MRSEKEIRNAIRHLQEVSAAPDDVGTAVALTLIDTLEWVCGADSGSKFGNMIEEMDAVDRHRNG